MSQLLCTHASERSDRLASHVCANTIHRSRWYQIHEQLCAHTKERSGVGPLGAACEPKRARGSESRIRVKLRSRATMGSISAAELAATYDFGRGIGTASNGWATVCEESDELEASCGEGESPKYEYEYS